MPSGAKRRKAAKKKKKKEAAISNGNGEVKVMESDSGENNSPASQDLGPQHNPFSKEEHDDSSPRNESMDSEKDGSLSVLNADEDVEEIVAKAESYNGDPVEGVLRSVRVDDESQLSEKNIVGLEMHKPEKEHASIVSESEADTAHVVQVVMQEDVIDAEPKSKQNEVKVHPSETYSELKETDVETLASSDTTLGGPSEETFGRQLPQLNVRIVNGKLHTGNTEVQESDEKEPLLLKAPRPVHKTPWTGCCGLFELFTGSS